MEKFIQTIQSEQAQQMAISMFLKFKQEKASGMHRMHDLPDLLKVGTYGIYDIVVRATMREIPDYKAMKFIEAWQFDGGIECGGSCNRRGGFSSVQEVIDFGLSAAISSYADFDVRQNAINH